MSNQAYFVYKLTCSAHDKVYIGVSQNPEVRMRQHRSKARSGDDQVIYKAMRKYGVDSFKMVLLYGSLDREHIFNEMEAHFIREYRSNERGFGYNMSEGGEGRSGPTTEATKKILQETSNAAWARMTEEEKQAHIEHLNRVRNTADSREKQSEAAKLQHADPIQKETHRKATATKNQDPEKRRLIAEKAKARWADPEFKAKMAAKYASAEQKELKSKAAKVRWATN
jgi:group I intron endonuclease